MARARRYALATRVRLEVYTVEAGTVMRDLHRLSLELFASRATALLAPGGANYPSPNVGFESSQVVRSLHVSRELLFPLAASARLPPI